MSSPTISNAAAAATITNYVELQSPYDYTPSLAPGLAFVIIFGTLTLIHIIIAIKFKYWYALLALVPGGILEVVGWSGRLWSHYSVLNSDPFIMQMCCLILGPAFYSAWVYSVLGYCIVSLGPAFSRLPPKSYLAIFLSADIVCLILQAIGGGMAAVASIDGTDTQQPTNIMLAGVLVQLGTMTIFTILAVDFAVRVITRKPHSSRIKSLESQGLWSGVDSPSSSITPSSNTQTNNQPPNDNSVDPSISDPSSSSLSSHAPDTDLEKATLPHIPMSQVDRARQLHKGKLLLLGTAFASAMIYARGVYRSMELAQGWTGYLMTNEPYFVWLDGLPMVLCFAVFAVLHPGWLIERGVKA